MIAAFLGLLLPIACGAATVGSDPPPGRRAALGIEGAALFVPEDFVPGPGGKVDVVLHLHGAAAVVEPALVEAGWTSTVLVTFNRKGLSRVYAEPFSDRTLLPRLLEVTRKALKELGVGDDLAIGRLFVSSFSAGFGGVRAMLRDPEHFAQIDGLIMADSIYCGYVGDPKDHRIDPALMDGFRRFALEAAAGRKAFLLSHSGLVPDGYASTGEVADYMISAVGGKPSDVRSEWTKGWTQTRSFAKGRFVVLGFAGTEGADHMNHLRQIGRLWRRFRALESDDVNDARR